MASSVSVSELQRNTRSIIDDCVTTGRAKRITRYNESPVTLITTERYLELLQTELAVKQQEMMVYSSLIRGWQDYQEGRVTPLRDILETEDIRREVDNA